MQYNKIQVVIDQFNLFGVPPNEKKDLYFEKTRHLSAESFTGYILVYLGYNQIRFLKSKLRALLVRRSCNIPLSQQTPRLY